MNQRLPIEAPPVGPQTAESSALLSSSGSVNRSAFTNASEHAETLVAPPIAPVAESTEQLGAPNSASSEQTSTPSTNKDQLQSTRRVSAAMLSFILHTVVLLLLAMVTVVPRVGDPSSSSVEFATGDSEQESELQAFEMLAAAGSAASEADVVVDQAVDATASGDVLNEVLGELATLDPTRREIRLPGGHLSKELTKATGDLTIASLAATGVEGRSTENRDKTAKARGGTLESELAVERALDWLAAHQLPNGSWSLVHSGGKCNGQCKNDGTPGRFEPAATGLALLAFLGAGYTHKSGKHQQTVRDGVYYLIQIMKEENNTGNFLHESERGMYNHGIAAFALCEAYQLSGDNDLKQPAQLAVNFIFSAQNYAGGWGYLAKQPGDLTISGWQMMAIKSAYAAGLDVQPEVILRIDNFLDTKQVPSGVFYGYGKPQKDPTCSAIGMMLRLFRGWTHTDPRALELGKFLVNQGVSDHDVYYNYYATLLLFHLGGPTWETWNPRMREFLVKSQVQSGHEAGSWYFEDTFAKEGGRLYTTAMSCMTLEVYYRFSPLYQQADKPFEL